MIRYPPKAVAEQRKASEKTRTERNLEATAPKAMMELDC